LLELDEEPREIAINRTSHFLSLTKMPCISIVDILSELFGYYATSKNIYGPYELREESVRAGAWRLAGRMVSSLYGKAIGIISGASIGTGPMTR